MTWTHTVTGGPWPERHGHRCRIVPPPDPAPLVIYPWTGLHETEVVILIENDPMYRMARSWSCVLGRRHITPIESP